MKIGIFNHPLSVAILALFALAATPALHASSACPTPLTLNSGTAGNSGGEAFDQGYLNIIAGAPATANITCNVLISIAANGSISTSHPNGNGFYDAGGDDNVVGVVNGGTTTLFFLNLSSATQDPFAFDGDGICGYASFSVGTCGANQGNANAYNPSGVTYSNITGGGSAGTVNFTAGIAPGATGFFSLEDPVALDLVVTTTPEPATLLMMGTGIAGFAGLMRRKFKK